MTKLLLWSTFFTLRVASSTLNVKIIFLTLRVNIFHIAPYCEKVLIPSVLPFHSM